jgi:4a-hydroxytetrahydrobiopterin dehydratase
MPVLLVILSESARVPNPYNDHMAERRKLADAEVRSYISHLPGWSASNEKLHKLFQFEDFAHAFGFMATAAVLIEKLNHHPEWSNVYNRVEVFLTTHDAGGITARDFELAHLLEKVSAPLVANK